MRKGTRLILTIPLGIIMFFCLLMVGALAMIIVPFLLAYHSINEEFFSG